MNIAKSLYHSTVCNLTMLRQTICDVGSGEEYGYVLVGDDLVSFKFIESVRKHLYQNPLNYVSTTNAESMVDQDFWDALDLDERKMVGPSLLILIGSGKVLFRELKIDATQS